MSADLLSSIRRILGTGALALTVAGTAHAEAYDFSRFLSGGGGGIDPAKQRIARQGGAYVCVDVSESRAPPGNRVLFTLWSTFPQPKSYIRNIAFDTGKHSDLFVNVSVQFQSPSVKAKIGSPKPHAFLPRFTPKYWFDTTHPGGLFPGNIIVFSATLGNGKTFADVISAMNEGLNPATASSGLRVGVIYNALLGGPPKGVATINDDGGFVTTSVSARCRRS